MQDWRSTLSTQIGALFLCAKQAVGNRGYTALGEQTLDPGKQKKGDTKESYYICSTHPSLKNTW